MHEMNDTYESYMVLQNNYAHNASINKTLQSFFKVICLKFLLGSRIRLCPLIGATSISRDSCYFFLYVLHSMGVLLA